MDVKAKTKVKVGIVGCGNISGHYFNGCKAFDILEVAACSDLVLDRAKAHAEVNLAAIEADEVKRRSNLNHTFGKTMGTFYFFIDDAGQVM